MADSRDTLESKKREQDNYKRINRLLQSVATSVVRLKFDSEFNPTCLKSTINRSRLKIGEARKNGFINQFQYTLLYPSNGEPSSSYFDITLMICLLRNLEPQVQILDSLPIDTDTSVAANLSRLKYYRNKVAHSQTFTLSTEDFKIWWKHIAKAICELGGESYVETCKKLKYCVLDENEKDLHVTIKKIVKGIREPDKEEYLYWIDDIDRYFPIPTVVDKITAAFEQHRFIVIAGQAGTGKTALARYVALNLHKNQDMTIFPVNNPNIIQYQLALKSQINSAAHKLKVKKMPVSGKKKQTKQTKQTKVLTLDTHDSKTNKRILIFVIDDFLGRYTINKRMTNAWKELYYEYFDISCNEIIYIYILATCREEIRKTYQFKSLKDLYHFEEYSTSEIGETLNDKRNIASCHMNPSTTEILFADDKIKKDYKFSTFCFLYSQLLLTENVDFFNNPNFAFKRELKEICARSEPCYIGLSLLTLFDGKLRKPLSDQISPELVSKLCVECKVSTKEITLYQIQQELDLVVGRYIIDEVTAYSLVHPEFYDILLNYFMKIIPKSLIAFGSNDFLQTRVQLEKSTNESSNFVSVVIEKNHAEIYFDRLIEEIKLSQFENAFQNMQVANAAYQEQLIQHIQKSDEVLQILASSCLPLILSVESDFSELVGLILEKREKLKMSREIVIVRQNDYDIIDYDDRELLKLELSNNDEEIILMFACLCGSVSVVKLLLRLGYYINYQNYMQKTPIHLACLRGKDEVVKVLLDRQSTAKEGDGSHKSLETDCDIDIQDVNGLTALHIACSTGHTNIVNLLLKKWKCSLSDTDEHGRIVLFAEDKFSVTDNQGRTALHLAFVNGSENIIKTLFQAISLSNTTDPGQHAEDKHEQMHLCNLINTQDKFGKTFLFTACEHDNKNCVKFLLKYSCCNINISNDRKETPVFRACQYDNTELVDILVKYKADVNIKDITGRTPLHVSVENKNENMVKSILNNKNCDVNAKNDKDDASYSALHFAVFRKNINIVKILLNAECNKTCDINLTYLDQKTPLMTAVSTGSKDIVKLLIKSGCDLDRSDSEGRKAFHIACENNYNGDIIALFLELKEDFNVNDVDSVLGRTGLHHAVTGNNIKAVKLLMKTKININMQDKYLETALHHAYRCNKLEIVRELLKNQECDINLPDNTGRNLLHIACKNNDISMVRTLLRKNCAINARDELDRTPLHMTMSSNYMDIFTILVKKGDLNDKNLNGQTLLHIACWEQRVGAVKLILQNACDVNMQDKSGKTALHIAAEGDDPSILRELLKIKCNLDLCDTSGKKARNYARENCNKEIEKLFIQFMGDTGDEKK